MDIPSSPAGRLAGPAPLTVGEIAAYAVAAAAEYEQRLFSQVPRRTHRGGFDPLPLSQGALWPSPPRGKAATRH